ncbi:MAG TPA: hypothetical protein VGM50_11690 [Gemmatimonadaceae bacterium]|jgi:hypothetical protein
MSEHESSGGSPHSVVHVNDQRSERTLSKLLILGLVAGAAIILAKQLPDLNRYLKMKRM